MTPVNDALSQHQATGQMPSVVGKLSPDTFMKFVDETRNQPAFRASMDKCADYYDGNQLSSDILAKLDNMGFTQLMTNLIKPAVDAVLGIEAKNRTDFRVSADSEDDQEVAEALSAKLAEAERESRADRACSDAYAGQCKTGLHWVHVARNSDPFLYQYKVDSVHRREMFWDWSAPVSDPALDTSRYTIRQKWFPVDQVSAAMPEHSPLINASASGWAPGWLEQASESTELRNAFDQESRISVSAWEWRNIDNRRIALQECWYATYIRGLVLDLGSRVVEFDKNNPLHMAAVGSGKFRPQPSVYRKLRCSIWFGPHLLQDYDPGTNKLPYVPFWGFREDLTGVPYGLVRNMIPLQDEVNARRRKLMWLLASKRVQVDSDALDKRFNDFDDLVDEISRPDSMTIMNPARLNKDGLKVESDLGLSQQQFEVLTEAKQGIQDAAGIYNSMMGKTDGAKSGVAINQLVEQGSNTLGEINDNFKFSRQRVGELLLDMIRHDMSGRQVDVVAGPSEARRKVISLNVPKVHELTGVTYKENDVDKAAVKVALEDVPSTPAYRAQQMMSLGELIKSLPPVAQAAMTPFFIEATDLPKRHEMADTARKAMGLPVGDEQQQDPQVMALQQQLQALQQQSEQMADGYEQAVQEGGQKAQELAQQVAQLQLQVRDKAGELGVRQRELELKAADQAAAAAERMRALEVKQAEAAAAAATAAKDAEFKGKELGLKEQELGLRAGEQAAAHEHRQAELEQSQLAAAQPPAEPAEPPRDEAKELEQLQTVVEKLVSPLADKVDMLIDAVQQDTKSDATEGEPAQAAAPAAASKPKAKVAAKRKVSIERDEDGRMTGFTIDGAAPK